MITRYLTEMIAGCVGVSDLGGRYEVTLANGTRRDATAAEVSAAEAAEATRIAEAQELTDQKAELRAQFKTAGDRLQQIADAASPTNAQVVQAMRDMATIQRKMLRAMYGILTD